ncbi:MAG TPA: glycosyltransferase [Dehalococcoidia bacterium]|nr:glycosyltransferase [Dehalococcoidia bacterium]
MSLPAPPLVSVIVPTRDRPALLREALGSIRALEGPDLALEVIVADNGANPETGAVAREFGARCVRAERLGASAARNAGLRAASGEFLAFLDDDDVWLAEHLRPQLALLSRRPELAAVLGQAQCTDEQRTPLYGPGPVRLAGDGDVLHDLFAQMPQIGALVARASVRETVGELDETLLSDEDWDWQLRIALKHLVGFVPVPCVLFRQRPVTADDDLRWRRWPYTRRVFLNNVRRASSRRPSLPYLARCYLRHCGWYYGISLWSALEHAHANERRAAARELTRALRIAPLHALRDLPRPGALWSTFGALIKRPRRRTAAAE